MAVYAMVEQLGRELRAANDNPAYTPNHRAAIANALAKALQLYARLSGSLDVTTSAIVRSTAWGRILASFERVFERHPEAQQALAEFAAELSEMGE